jgi:hypothetical protein
MQSSTLPAPQLEQQPDQRDPKRDDSHEQAPPRRPEPARKVDEPSLPYLPIG